VLQRGGNLFAQISPGTNQKKKIKEKKKNHPPQKNPKKEKKKENTNQAPKGTALTLLRDKKAYASRNLEGAKEGKEVD